MHSWGYLQDRCNYLGRNLSKELSRVVSESELSYEYNEEMKNSEMKIKGRIVLDVWRLLRHEVIYYLRFYLKLLKFMLSYLFFQLAVQSYTFENMVYLILHQRVPSYSYETLSFWWNHDTFLYRYIHVIYNNC